MAAENAPLALSSGLSTVFEPGSIAFVGATDAEEKMGGRRWKSLVEGGFAGRLYPIHPRADKVRGHKAYKSVRELPEVPDFVVIVVAAEFVPGIVADCAALGVGAVMVISGGFSEVGEAGRRLEIDLVRQLRGSRTRLIGPNCAGLFSASGKVDIGGWRVVPGSIALVSQSGNMAIDFARHAEQSGSGFSRSVTIGNATDLGSVDFLEYFLHDPESRVILAYIEGFREGEGRRLVDLLRTARARKPIVLLKPGRSDAGRRAALSHTGALAGEDSIVDAALEAAGVVRAETIDEAWHIAHAFATQPLPGDGGVLVLTDGGGHATTFADAAGTCGLEVADLTPMTQARLHEALPERCSRQNPIDFAGEAEADPEIIGRALRIGAADPNVAAVVIVGHFGGYHLIAGARLAPKEIAAAGAIGTAARESRKPVFLHSVHGDRELPPLQILRESGIPVFRRLELPARILRGLRAGARYARRSPCTTDYQGSPGARWAVDDLLGRAIEGNRPVLLEPESRELLSRCGIEIPAWREVNSAEECHRAVVELGGNCALKAIAPEAIHRTELGAVMLNVTSAEAHSAYNRLVARLDGKLQLRSVLVTAMITDGTEVVVGATRDLQFGPVLMVGSGGVRVELERDVAFRLAPVTGQEVAEMLAATRLGPLFRGYRGRPALDLERFTKLVVKIGDIIVGLPAISEIDLNPVIVSEHGLGIADVRVALRS